jgi:uncharacterized protein (DUF1697 family)
MRAVVALLRAINVGGANRLTMADLRETLGRGGFTGVQTVLQSGNVVCGSPLPTARAAERRMREALLEQRGLDLDVFVRTAEEWRGIIAANPFTAESRRDPSHLVVIAFANAIASAAVSRLQKVMVGRERLIIEGSNGYVVYPDGIGTSRLTASVIERTLDTRATARNWNTVLKLGALLDRDGTVRSHTSKT